MAKGKGLSPGSGGPGRGNSQAAHGAGNGVGTQDVFAGGKKKYMGSTVKPVGKRKRGRK